MTEDAIDEAAIARAGRILKDGGLVAFPTETVYGLGGDALNPESSKKIYAAKGRPSDNPLIVHVCRWEDVAPIVEEIPKEAEKLAAAFWPGPMTMIFNKSSLVPYETTGGLDTVAVRFPSNKIAAAMIRAGGGYIAAPSANKSGRPSPTEALYCKEDLDGKVEMIIDGGQVGIGLESTIIDLTEEKPTILRPGYITKEMLEKVLGEVDVDRTIIAPNSGIRPKAPGMKYRHYAPQGDLAIVEGSPDLFSVVDAYKCLFNICYWAGKDKEALYYANKYRETGDSLDLGKRQELAATVNNQYKYHLDREKEFRLNEERDRLRYTITIISITSVMAAVLLGLLLIVRKNRGLREKLALIKEIDARRLRQEELQDEIRKREGELETSRQHLDHVQGKLDALQERLSRTTREAEDLEKELRDKERQLSDRTAQNRLLIGLLHESKLEDKAEDVIQSIRQTSKGMKNMTAASWRQLYQAVDELHPKFRDQLSAQFGKLNDQQLKVCYLMKIGLPNLQIRNMTNLSRVTVWRWVKKYNWILFPPES